MGRLQLVIQHCRLATERRREDNSTLDIHPTVVRIKAFLWLWYESEPCTNDTAHVPIILMMVKHLFSNKHCKLTRAGCVCLIHACACTVYWWFPARLLGNVFATSLSFLGLGALLAVAYEHSYGEDGRGTESVPLS